MGEIWGEEEAGDSSRCAWMHCSGLGFGFGVRVGLRVRMSS